MAEIIKVFFDVETTGLDFRKHSIHQLAGLIEVDGEIVEKFNLRAKPHPKAEVTQDALKISGITEEELYTFPDQASLHREFRLLIDKYVDRYNKRKKAFLVGYNNRGFDDDFLRKLFTLQGDKFFGSYFWSNSLDAMVLITQYLLKERRDMPNFKLETVAKTLGIEEPAEGETGYHDALFDVMTTRQIYRIAVGLEIEPKFL